MKYTILGSSGFIGKNLSKSLFDQKFEAIESNRNHPDWLKNILKNDLGHVIYCIGLTADFRKKPFETIDAHICILKDILKTGNFKSLTYLSSTRVYEGGLETTEDAILKVSPINPSHFYNLSKLMGESLCINSAKNVKIIRLSNVYGNEMNSNNFLCSVLSEAAKTGKVNFQTSPESSKDFISITDVVNLVPKIAVNGSHSIYNLASGKNTSNKTIANILSKEGVGVSFSKDAVDWSFPEIKVDRIKNEFPYNYEDLAINLANLYKKYHQKAHK